MAREFEFYHGAALIRLIHNYKNTNVEQYSTSTSNASYVIDDKVGLYLKYSSSRLSPWVFTFKQEHIKEIEAMKEILTDVFTVLICGRDGMACLSYLELKLALGNEYGSTEWLKAARRVREKYAISGSDGKLKTKIGDNEFPAKVIYCLESTD